MRNPQKLVIQTSSFLPLLHSFNGNLSKMQNMAHDFSKTTHVVNSAVFTFSLIFKSFYCGFLQLNNICTILKSHSNKHISVFLPLLHSGVI